MSAAEGFARRPRLRLALTLWLAGMAGVTAVAFGVLPDLLARQASAAQVPAGVAIAASLAQGGVLLALAVWAGAALAHALGLGAPALEAWLAGGDPVPALRRMATPALAAGAGAGLWLVALAQVAPAPLRAAGEDLVLPLAARVLYGGITEEILMRWGLMTLLAWIAWRLLPRTGDRRGTAIAIAAVMASLAFALGHLPVVAALGLRLDAPVLAWVLVGNAVPGLVFGALFARRGLEAAIVAHGLAHLVAAGAAALHAALHAAGVAAG